MSQQSEFGTLESGWNSNLTKKKAEKTNSFGAVHARADLNTRSNTLITHSLKWHVATALTSQRDIAVHFEDTWAVIPFNRSVAYWTLS